MAPPHASPASPDNAAQVRADQWHLDYLSVKDAHRISRGAGVLVALPDTGVDPHPDLTRNLLEGKDLIAQRGDGLHDANSHGTAMAGLIAAHGSGEGLGALGIAPEAKILPLISSTSDNYGNADTLAEAIDYAVTQHADVISISSAGVTSEKLVRAVSSALAADIIVVAGVGNLPEAAGVGFPAAQKGVIAVAGIDRSGRHAAFSVSGPRVDVAAPAVDIYSTSFGGKYSKGTGTSSATAIVAGAAALIRSKYPDLPAEEVAHRLTATAIDKGPPGRDDQYGYGVIDLVAALTADVPPLGFESTGVTAPAPPGTGGDDSTVRGLATLGVLLAAGGGYLIWRRHRRAGDPPPRISR
ncbi:S8 family serine peptidase [Micromonospora sp. WMMD998]|uniref:S8 family serine peptidase n=1 Tax=Micromonospora sp. WMMD998 TaxID=3016092 RepID=UPI00249ADB2C|nr:S8 family serine peptidase [Micromonospora sp. WMMD998]WFE42565.1 S8 family serine peptidase [Micromonospora sp. WMMD998]